MNKTTIFALVAISMMAACGPKPEPKPAPIEVRTIEVQRPAPIVPTPDRVSLKPVKWTVINEQNASERLKKTPVYFALDEAAYKALAYNMSELRGYTEQQAVVIKAYKDHFKR